MAKQQKVKIEIDKRYGPKERTAIAQEIILFMIQRSKRGKDKNGRRFPGYSKDYVKNLDFKNAGKSKGKVNLTLTDEMLNSIELLTNKPGELTLGFDRDDNENNGKAEGNILGTYGQKTPIPGKKRDFLGISGKDLKRILKKYPLRDSDQRKLRATLINEIIKGSDNIAEDLTFQELNQEVNELEEENGVTS